MLEAVAAEERVTEPRAALPSLTRLTARVIESPGTKPVVVTGTPTPCWLTSMERVPDWMVVATGVVLSVKLPNVPMPATAAAAPRTPSEPTTLRAVELLRALLLMSVSPCVRASGPSLTQTTIREQPQDTRAHTARNPQEVGARWRTDPVSSPAPTPAA